RPAGTDLQCQVQPIVVQVGHDDMPCADVAAYRRGHDADRPGPGDQHVFPDEVEAQSRMGGVAQRVQDRGDLIGDVIGNLERIEGGDHQELGKCSFAVHADADRVAAQVTPAGAAIAAIPARHVALARYAIADPATAHLRTHPDHL